MLDANGIGAFWVLEYSFDNFATSNAWSTASYNNATQTFDARIISIGHISSGFSLDGLPAPATVDVELANVDGQIDWLVSTVPAAQVNNARFRLSLYTWDNTPAAVASAIANGLTIEPTVQVQQFGVYVMLDWPKRYTEKIKLTLADDLVGRINDGLVAPTIREWVNNVITNYPLEVCPLKGVSPVANLDWDAQFPLAFGMPSLKCYAAANDYRVVPGSLPPAWQANKLQAVGDRITNGGNGNPLADNIYECITAGYSGTVGPPASPGGPSGTGQDITVVGGGSHWKYVNAAATNTTALAIPICATTDLNGTPGPFNGITKLDIEYRTDIEYASYFAELVGARLGIPKSYSYVPDAGSAYQGAPVISTVWQAYLSNTIMKNGVGWRVLWVSLDVQKYITFVGRSVVITTADSKTEGNTPPATFMYPAAKGTTNTRSIPSAAGAAAAWYVSGYPMSERSVQNSLMQNASDIVQDLIAYYSTASIADVDGASFAKAKAATSALYIGGVINPFAPPQNTVPLKAGAPITIQPGLMREALRNILASADMDLYVRRIDGKFALACSFFTFDDITSTKLALDATRVSDIEETRPSVGARWYPFNRVYLTTVNNETLGPFDNPAGLTALGGVQSKTLNAKWMVLVGSAFTADYLLGVWGLRNLETRVRSVVRFRADKSALSLDLAGFFTFSWYRGALGYAYNGTAFAVERMVIDPGNLTVDIEAVNVDDMVSERAYLLDDENIITVATGNAGRTVTCVDLNVQLTFSSGSIITDGVAAGDIIVLQDASESDEGFKRNKALRVSFVVDATHLNFDPASDPDVGDFGGGGTFSGWTIQKGATHYPTSGSDPANYPFGGAVYGKASNDDTHYSDDSNANTLKEG